MYYDAFSSNVNQVINVATELAKRSGCKYIGSEHILFGLINVSDGRAASILKEAGVVDSGGRGLIIIFTGFYKCLIDDKSLKINYEEFGGALLLGVKGITVISHGRSKAYAIKNAVRVAKEAVETGVNSKISAFYEG